LQGSPRAQTMRPILTSQQPLYSGASQPPPGFGGPGIPQGPGATPGYIMTQNPSYLATNQNYLQTAGGGNMVYLKTNTGQTIAVPPGSLQTAGGSYLQTNNNLIQTFQPNTNVIVRPVQAPAAPILSGFVHGENESGISPSQSTLCAIVPPVTLKKEGLDLLGLGTPGAAPEQTAPFRVEELLDILNNLSQASEQHAALLSNKQTHEQQAQVTSNNLWTFPVVQKKVQGKVDSKPWIHTYQYKLATFNETNHKILAEKFDTLHKLLQRPLWLSLCDQTLQEIELSKFFQEHHDELKTDLNKSKVFFECLCNCLSQKGSSLSPHAIAVLRNLVLCSGILLVGNASKSAAVSTEFNILGLDALQAAPAPKENDLSLFVAEKLSAATGCHWGRGLLQPTVDSLRFNWMQSLKPQLNQDLTEFEYISFLSQVPWIEVLEQIELSAIKQQILLPLQGFMADLANAKFLQAMVLIGKILIFISDVFPVVKLTCLGILLRSPWPSAAVTESLFVLCRFNELKDDEIVPVFTETYQLFDVPVEVFATLTPEERQKHRNEWIDIAVQNQVIGQQVLKIDPQLAAANKTVSFPLFFIFERLASRLLEARSPMALLIVEELFYYGFVWTAVPPPLKAWSQLIKQSAAQTLAKLCAVDTSIISFLIKEIGQKLAAILPHAATVIQCFQNIKLLTWEAWTVDLNSASVVAYFLSRRPWIKIDTTNELEYQKGIRALLQNAGVLPVKFGPLVEAIASDIGCLLFDQIQWKTCNPVWRLQVLYAFCIMESNNTPQFINWQNSALTKLQPAMLQGPYDVGFVTQFIDLQLVRPEGPVKSPGNERVLQLVQTLLAAGLVRQKFTSQDGSIDGSYNIGWFYKAGHFPKYLALLEASNKPYAPPATVLTQLKAVLDALKYELSYEVLTTITNLLVTCLAHQPTGPAALSKQISDTLAVPSTETPLWLSVWIRILAPKYAEPTFQLPLSHLVHGLFCQQVNFSDIGSILHRNPVAKDTIHKTATAMPWICYLALWGHQPRIPASLQFAQIEDSSLWLAHQVALKVQDPILALIFWERFFALYFEFYSVFQDRCLDFFPPGWQTQLNSHFVNTANKVHKSIGTIYYNFSTWESSNIFPDGVSFFVSNDNEILSAFCHAYAPPFPKPQSPESQLLDPTSHPFFASQRNTQTRVLEADDLPAAGSLLPSPEALPYDHLTKEQTLWKTYKAEINKNLQSLQSIQSQPGSPQFESETLPVINDLTILLEHAREIAASLRTTDLAFLELLTQQYYNHVYHQKISSPFPAVLKSYRIGPQFPTVVDDIKDNRKNYNVEYLSFFDISRSIAQAISLLKSLSKQLVSSTESTPALGLFFKLLPIAVGHTIPPKSAMRATIIDILMEIGTKFVATRTDLQILFLTSLLSHAEPTSKEDTEALKAQQQIPEKKEIQPIKSTLGVPSELQTLSSIQRIPLVQEADLTTLLRPLEFLNIGAYDQFAQLVVGLLSTSTRMDENDLTNLISKFELERTLPIVLSQGNLANATLLDLFKTSLTRSSFAAIAFSIAYALLSRDYNENSSVILNLILTAPASQSKVDWGLNPSCWGISSAQQAYNLFALVVKSFPFTDWQLTSALSLARCFVLSKEFVAQLSGENQILYSAEGMTQSPTWEIVEYFLKNTFASLSSDPQNTTLALTLLVDVVLACPLLIDRVWGFFCDVLVPYFGAFDSSIQTILLNGLSKLPWEQATFHYNDTQTLPTMSLQTRSCPTICAMIFGKLNWRTWAEKIKLPQFNHESHACHFLTIFLTLNLVAPSSIDSQLRNLILGISTNDNWFMENQYIIDWRSISVKEFQTVFNGTLLYNIVLSESVKSDPTLRLMQNFQLLVDIANFIADPHAIRSVFIEIQPFIAEIFSSIHSADQCWYLPLMEQSKILSSMLMPTCVHHLTLCETFQKTRPLSNIIVSDPLAILLSFATPLRYKNGPTYHQSKLEFLSREIPAPNSSENVAYHEKTVSLLKQFCANSSVIVAKYILKYAHLVLSSFPALMMEFMEGAIHAFLRNIKPSEITSGMSYCAKFIETKISWHDLLQSNTAANSVLTYRALLEKHVRALSVSHTVGIKWVHEVCQIFKPTLNFIPLEHHEFDLIALWFYLLEILSDTRFVISPQTKPVLELLEKQLNWTNLDFFTKMASNATDKLFDFPETNSILFIASKALFLYFCEILQSKTTCDPASAKYYSSKQSDCLNSLLSVQKDPRFGKFAPFFEELGNGKLGEKGLNVYEGMIIRTLVPIAPYMMKLIRLSKKDIRWLAETGFAGAEEELDDNPQEDEDSDSFERFNKQ